MQENSIRTESIGNGVSIYTDDAHHFGTDAILLAHFAAPKKSDIACDLGSGCGIIPFLWFRYGTPQHTTALELQAPAVALMQKSIAANGAHRAIRALCADIRSIEAADIALHSFSLVTVNPPYFAEDSGYCNEAPAHTVARHEITCTTEDVMQCADKLLRYGGRLCLCQKPERLTDILCAMRACNIEPKKLRFVCGRQGKSPYLVLIEGKKGGGKALKVLPELAVQQADGSWSEEMLAIYQDYGDGTKK